jgi:hypothetical protein
MHNNNFNNLLSESLGFKDLDGMMKPTIHVDEFSSKMGDDDDVIVVSFFVSRWFDKIRASNLYSTNDLTSFSGRYCTDWLCS